MSDTNVKNSSTPAPDTTQVKFLVACIKYNKNGRPDFEAVANELDIVSKAAAAKRYERMLKAHGVTKADLAANNDSSPSTPAKKRASNGSSSASKKAKVAKKKESDDEDDMPKTESGGEGEKPKPKAKAKAPMKKEKDIGEKSDLSDAPSGDEEI